MNNLLDKARLGIGRFISTHSFMVLVVGALALALVFVSVAMTIYENSDAARLDLSHPDYRNLRSEISNKKTEDFSSSGAVSLRTLEEFERIFKSSSEQVLNLDAFGGDVLSDETLNINMN